MRNCLLLVFLVAAPACERPEAATERALASGGREADDSGRLECAVEGAAAFERVCTLDREAGADGLELTIRHPSGGFRRLLVTADGRGVVAADGADPALVSVVADNRIEVAIAGDRYRLPATVEAGVGAGQ